MRHHNSQRTTICRLYGTENEGGKREDWRHSVLAVQGCAARRRTSYSEAAPTYTHDPLRSPLKAEGLSAVSDSHTYHLSGSITSAAPRENIYAAARIDLHHGEKNHENRLARSLCHTKNTNFQTHKTYKRHSGYYPWIHGKFICKGEGKWSCSGLRSYRSYGSEAVGWPYEQARRPPHRFRPTPLVASLPMIFHYHLLIGEVRTIRNETAYPIHGKYPLNP